MHPIGLRVFNWPDRLAMATGIQSSLSVEAAPIVYDGPSNAIPTV